MSEINLSQWGKYLQGVADDSNKLLAINKKGNFQLIDKNNPSKAFKRISLDKITSLTLNVLEEANEIDESDRAHIRNGLHALVERRKDKYDKLHPVRKFFSGKRTERRIQEDAIKTDYIASLISTGHTRTNQLLQNFEYEIPSNLAPEALEAAIATLLKDRKITDVEANHATLYKMCEESANKYFKKMMWKGPFAFECSLQSN